MSISSSLSAIQEFVSQLRQFEPNDNGLKMFEAVINRCVKKDPKAKEEKVNEAMRNFTTQYLPFLENNMTLGIVPKDTTINYDVQGKVHIPIGTIISKSKSDRALLTNIRKHLIIIGALVAGPQSNQKKLKKLLKEFAEVPSAPSASKGGGGGGDDDEEFDEDDKAFFSTLPQIPGMDMQALMKVGKQSFGDMTPGASKEEMVEKLKEGVVGLLDSEMFQNLLATVTAKAENGELGDVQGMQGMQQMMTMGQGVMAAMMAQQPKG
jgi:hypothetical protein